jgi:hypothetical protein
MGSHGGCQVSVKIKKNVSKNPIGAVNRTNIDQNGVKGTKNKRNYSGVLIKS